MEKIQLLISFWILSTVLGGCLVFAGDPSFTANTHGDAAYTQATGTPTTETTGNTDHNKAPDTIQENFEIQGKLERTSLKNATITNFQDVYTNNDLYIFSQSVARNNKEIVSVVSREDRVSVSRTVPTKLFWIIPTTTEETAEIISWGNGLSEVNVTRPWWVMFSTNTAISTTLSNDIEDKIESIPRSKFKIILDPSTKAELILVIQNAFLTYGFASGTLSQ